MPTKEQELTFENIAKFFSLAEEIVEVISENIEQLSESNILERLKIVEKFIEQAVSCAEIISEDYKRIVSYNEGQQLAEDNLREQIILMILSLDKCREQLLEKLGGK